MEDFSAIWSKSCFEKDFPLPRIKVLGANLFVFLFFYMKFAVVQTC